jgi:hypothetical protein
MISYDDVHNNVRDDEDHGGDHGDHGDDDDDDDDDGIRVHQCDVYNNSLLIKKLNRKIKHMIYDITINQMNALL